MYVMVELGKAAFPTFCRSQAKDNLPYIIITQITSLPCRRIHPLSGRARKRARFDCTCATDTATAAALAR